MAVGPADHRADDVRVVETTIVGRQLAAGYLAGARALRVVAAGGERSRLSLVADGHRRHPRSYRDCRSQLAAY